MNALFSAGSDPGGHGLTAALYELGLLVSDLGRSVDFYERAFGYRFAPDGEAMLGVGPRRRLRLVPSPDGRLGPSHVGFAVTDESQLDTLGERLAVAGVAHRAIDRVGYRPSALAFADPDGNAMIFGLADAADIAPGPDALPGHLQHAVFSSTDIEAMLRFYRDVVGFGLSDAVVNDEGLLTTFFAHCSQEHHSLAVFRAGQNRFDHHCYEAGDWGLIRDWGDRFASLHIPIKWGPGRHGPGNNLFLFIHDPDDYWLEISAELELLEPGRTVGVWPHAERTLNSWGIAYLRK